MLTVSCISQSDGEGEPSQLLAECEAKFSSEDFSSPEFQLELKVLFEVVRTDADRAVRADERDEEDTTGKRNFPSSYQLSPQEQHHADTKRSTLDPHQPILRGFGVCSLRRSHSS